MSESLFAASLRALGRAPMEARARTLAFDWRAPASLALALTLGMMALRTFWGLQMGLGVDESYSVGVARDLAPSYFDHPPMHYWLAHAVQPLVGTGRGERAPFILLFGGSSWLMFLLGRRLFGETAGLWSCLALNVSGFFTVAGGGWVLPDGPLIFFELAAAVVLAALLFAEEAAPQRRLALWLAAGVLIGLAGLSKYQAALFAAGLGVFLVTTARGRRELASPGPYLAAGLALAVLSPVIAWNAAHHWASFAFQAGRGAPSQLHPLGPIVALAGQFGVLLPWVFVPTAAAVISAARAGPIAERRWLCLMLGAPAVLIFTLAPVIGAPTLPHWPMPGWLLLLPLLGERLAVSAETQAWPRRWATASLVFVAMIGTLASLAAGAGWLGAQFPAAFRRGDPTAESIEWSQLRPALAQSAVLREPGAFIAALKWNEAGKLDQAVGDVAPVTVLSSDPRQFAYRHPAAGLVGQDALIIGKADTIDERLADITPYFRSVRRLPPVRIGREGHDEITLDLVEARGLLRPYDAAH